MFKFIEFWKEPEPAFWVCETHGKAMPIYLAIEPTRHFCPHCLSEFLETKFPIKKEATNV